MGFTRAQLRAFEGAMVPDLVGDDPRLVFVGINPGLWTAAVGTHFARRGNRFYPALYRAGITRWQLEAAEGLSPADEAHLLARGVAITNICERASARADELSAADLREGAARLEQRIAAWAPPVVAVLGVTAYRIACGRRDAVAGKQPERLGGARLWVLGNPSGLNAHENVDSLARAYREPAVAAGVPLDPPRWDEAVARRS